MVGTLHTSVTPRDRCIVAIHGRIDVGHEHTRPVGAGLVDNPTLWIDDEVGPGVLSGTVICADPVVIARGGSLQRCGHRHQIVSVLLRSHVGVVEGNEHQLHPSFLVFPEELRIAEVVTNQQAALYPTQSKGDKVGTRTVMFQVAGVVTRSRTEQLVVACLDASLFVDDIQGIVRLVFARQSMIGCRRSSTSLHQFAQSGAYQLAITAQRQQARTFRSLVDLLSGPG